MFSLVEILSLSGLILYVIGAAVIAVPDIPHLRHYHKPGKMRKGLLLLQLNRLTPDSIGFREIKTELESLFGERIRNDIVGLGVSVTKVVNPMERKVTVAVDKEEGEYYYLGEVRFEVVRYVLESEIKKGEAYIRGIGFVLLSIEFGLQIVSIVLT